MPTHPRTTARANLVALLAGAATLAGSRWYDSAFWPASEPESPAGFVYTPTDEAYADEATPGAYADLGDPVLQRSLVLEVRCRVAKAVDPEADLDELCRQVEQAIDGDRTLSGSIERIAYLSTEIVPVEGSNPQAIEAIMSFRAVYLDDFS